MSEKLFALNITSPILIGFIAVGAALGILAEKTGQPYITALALSMLVYAGSSEFMAITLMANNAPILEIVIATILINSRHMFYGLSLIDKFNNIKNPLKTYLIFGLTDETYALLTSTHIPEKFEKNKSLFYITLLPHIYWVASVTIGYYLGKNLSFDFQGIHFALTALFILLTIEQWKAHKSKKVFLLAILSSSLALLIGGTRYFLILSFILVLISLIVFRKKIEDI